MKDKKRYLRLTIGIIVILFFVMGGIGTIYLNKQKSSDYQIPQIDGCVYVTEVWGDFNDMKIIQEVNQSAGVDVKFEMLEITNRVNSSLIGDVIRERSDFIMGADISTTDVESLKQGGEIIPLNDLIEEHAPNIMAFFQEHPEIYEELKDENGQIYTLPGYDEGVYTTNRYLYINKKWLDDLGLEMPQTLEEFYKVLVAFKTQDPNGNGEADEIPFSFIENEANNDINLFMGNFGLAINDKHMVIKDDGIVYAPIQEEYKQGIEYLHRLYEEGLLDKEVFTHNRKAFNNKGTMDDQVYGAFIAYRAADVVGVNEGSGDYSDYVVLQPLKAGEVEPVWNSQNEENLDKHRFMITSNNQYPEETIKWIDQFFSPHISFQMQFGKIGDILFADEVGIYQYHSSMIKEGYWNRRVESCPGYYVLGMKTTEMYDKINIDILTDAFSDAEAIYEPYMVEDTRCGRIDEEFAKDPEIRRIECDLICYTAELKMKWIVGERDIETDWQAYKHQVHNLGVEQYINSFKEIYEMCCGKDK